jgi:peptidoglycan/xylan/chitin deacetylase (PgdA/CDA1 family)
MTPDPRRPGGASRRAVLASLVTGAAGALAACTPSPAPQGSARTPAPTSGAAAPSSPPPSPAPAGPAATPTGTVPPPGPDIDHGPRTTPAVALTFHGAGDPAITQDVVRVLAGAGALVTVMAIGTWLAEDPGTAKLLLDAGHELGNHTWSHQTMPRLSPGAAQAEVQRAADELRALTGSPGRWFRPSGTAQSTPTIQAAAAAAGYGACLLYDVDPLDYTDPGPTSIEDKLLGAVQNGSIVSLHLGHAGTRDALPAVLDGLRQRGLAAVTASQLLGIA